MSEKSRTSSRQVTSLVFCLWWSFGICVLVPKISKTVLYSATSDLAKLIKAESRLVEFLNDYIEQEEAKLERLKRMAGKAKRNQLLALEHGIGTYTNPVNVFLALQRVDQWRLEEEYIKNGSDNELLDLIHKDPQKMLGSLLPAEDDLHGAANALFRLQDTYALKARVLSDGQLTDNPRTETLSAGECFELARVAYSALNDNYHALIWFKEAWRKLQFEEPPTATVRQTLDYLISALYAQGNTEHALDVARKLNMLYPDYSVAEQAIAYFENELKLNGKDPSRVSDAGSSLPPIVNVRPNDGHLENREGYEALCRGEDQDQSEWSRLYCYYKRDTPYSLISPFKVEIVRLREPRVVLFRNVVTDREIEMLKALAEPKFYTTEHLLFYRVSKSAWVSDIEDALVKSLSRRIEEATGLSMETAEQLHLSCYGIAGHYEPHFDFYTTNEEDTATFHHVRQTGGNRIATVLVYLSTPYLGGATVFTELKLTLHATKNDAAFWFNMHRNGTVNRLTRHAACPVLAGIKWIGNKWLHERGQEFRYPCRLENV